MKTPSIADHWEPSSIVSSTLPSSSHEVIRILEKQGQARHHSSVHRRFTARRPRDAFLSRALRTGSRLGQADVNRPGRAKNHRQALFYVHTVLVMMAAHHLSSLILILLLPISLHIPGETVPLRRSPLAWHKSRSILFVFGKCWSHQAISGITPRRLQLDVSSRDMARGPKREESRWMGC